MKNRDLNNKNCVKQWITLREEEEEEEEEEDEKGAEIEVEKYSLTIFTRSIDVFIRFNTVCQHVL